MLLLDNDDVSRVFDVQGCLRELLDAWFLEKMKP